MNSQARGTPESPAVTASSIRLVVATKRRIDDHTRAGCQRRAASASAAAVKGSA
jgi:hypothetical protein